MNRARTRFIYFGYRGAAAFLRAVPGPVGRACAGGVALVAWTTGPGRRAVVASNLRHVLGPDAPPATLRRTVRRAYVSYAAYWSEASRLDARDPALLGRRVVARHPERFHDALARGRGLILVLPHVGCWEPGAVWAAGEGYPLMTVGEALEPPELFDWFVETRKRVELTMLPPGPATTAQLLDHLRVGKALALAADRDVVGDGLRTEFFGAVTRVPAGPAVLALRSGAPVLPVAIYLEPRGRFTVEFPPELDTTRTGNFRSDVARLTRDMVAAFEQMIASRPEQWHVFQQAWPRDDAEADG